MKMINIILTITIFMFIGCIGYKHSVNQDNGSITINVSENYPKKALILQDFLDVEYIPLETKDEFLTSGIVQAIGKKIILIRNTNRAGSGDIFIFDREGKGLRRINRRGPGNEEYTNITGRIVLDEDNDELFVSCIDLRRVFVYDLYGNFRRSFKYIEGEDSSSRWKTEIFYDPIYNFDQNNLICHDNSNGRNFVGKGSNLQVDVEPRNIFWIISKQDGRITREIKIPFEKKILQVLFSNAGIGVVLNPGLIPYKNHWLLVEPSSDTIYNYSTNHDMEPFIVRTPSVQLMNPEVFIFPGVITNHYYFLQTVKKEYDATDPQSGLKKNNLVYDRQKKKIFEYIVYNDDYIYRRPLKNLTDAPFELTVINNDEIAFVEKIEAFELVEAYQKNKLKGKLKEIAAGLHEESNPVIMIAKYKK